MSSLYLLTPGDNLHFKKICGRVLGHMAEKKTSFKKQKGDSSQAWRSGIQITFLLLNLWIGLQFLLWVRYYETGGLTWKVDRPPGVEGWLPIASIMNLKAWLLSGDLPQIHPAGVFLLLAFIAASAVLTKSFCSWLCPIGTLSETLWQLGERVLSKTFKLPRFPAGP